MSKKTARVDSIKDAGFRFHLVAGEALAPMYDLHSRTFRIPIPRTLMRSVAKEDVPETLKQALFDPTFIQIEVRENESICVKHPSSWNLPSAWDAVNLTTGYIERLNVSKELYSYVYLPAGWALVERPSIPVTPLVYVRMAE